MWSGPSRTSDPSRRRTSPSFFSQFHFPAMGEWGLRQLSQVPKLEVQCKHGGKWGEEMGGFRNRAGGGGTGKALDHRFSSAPCPRSLRLTLASGVVAVCQSVLESSDKVKERASPFHPLHQGHTQSSPPREISSLKRLR